MDLQKEILKLKNELNAVILSHFYQDEEIQDIADFVGDSLDLSRKAHNTNADVIVFCGVKFMAEVAKILSPDKKVIIPDINAGCSLEESCRPNEFKKFIYNNPSHIVITYINCSADIKTLSDIIITSTNAEKIINNIPKDQKIIFAPDKHLGKYLIKKTNRDMLLWNGSCIVHERFSEKELIKLKNKYQDAIILAHPECPDNLLEYANHIGSTSSIVNFSNQNQGKEFIILTEPNIINYMKLGNPSGKFYDCPSINESSCSFCNHCPYMQLNDLEKLYSVMKNMNNEILLNDDIINKARKPLDRMLSLS